MLCLGSYVILLKLEILIGRNCYIFSGIFWVRLLALWTLRNSRIWRPGWRKVSAESDPKRYLLYVSFVTMFSTVKSFHQFNALFLCSNLLLFCQNELLFAEIEYMQKRVNNASYFICLFGFFFFFFLLVLRVIFAFQHTQLQLSSN